MFVGLYAEAENNTKTDIKKLASRESLNKKKCSKQKIRQTSSKKANRTEARASKQSSFVP